MVTVTTPLRTTCEADPSRPALVLVQVLLPPELDCEGSIVCIQSVRMAGQLLCSPLIPSQSRRTATPGVLAPWAVDMTEREHDRDPWRREFATACVSRDGLTYVFNRGVLRVLQPGAEARHMRRMTPAGLALDSLPRCRWEPPT